MKNQERYEKYIKENCSRYKNKNGNECEIRISQVDNMILTRCSFYEEN